MTANKTNMLKSIALVAAGIMIGVGIGYTKIGPFLKWSAMSSTGNGTKKRGQATFRGIYQAGIRLEK